MTAAAWKRAVMPLLVNPEGWAFKSKTAYVKPVGWLLRGVLAEGSQTRDALYIWVLLMPLFVPFDNIVLSHSARLPGRQHLDDPAALTLALAEALTQVPSEVDGLRQVAASRREGAAYASLLLGDVAGAQEELCREYAPTDDRPFVLEARLRRQRIKELLDADGPDAATEQLGRWRRHSLAAIGIG